MKTIIVEYPTTNSRDIFIAENNVVLANNEVIWIHNPDAYKIIIYAIS